MYNPKEYWEKRASSWIKETWDTAGQWEQIKKYIDPKWNVLELGCGTGRWSEYFKNYEGWDISSKLIKHCRKKYPDKKFKVMPIEGKIPKYDLIFTYTSLLHVLPEVLKKVEFPDTRLLFVEPYQESNVEHCFGREYDKYFDVELLETIRQHKIWGRNIKPTVSVIMPTYNQPCYLAEAIQSVLDQSYPHFELIIINDGSTDDISDIINFYKDPRIKYFEKHNTGLPDTLNYGIERSTGNIIIRADDDDIQEPYKIDRLISNIIGYDFVYGGYYHSNIHGKPTEEIKPNQFTLENIYNNSISGSCSFACYRKVFDKVKYRPDMVVREDLAFWWDLYKTKMKANVIDIPIYDYRLLETGISYSRKKEVEENTKKIKEEIDGFRNSSNI